MTQRRCSTLALTLPAKDAELVELTLPCDLPSDSQCVVLRRRKLDFDSSSVARVTHLRSGQTLTYYEPTCLERTLLYLISEFRNRLFLIRGLGWCFIRSCGFRGLHLATLKHLVAQDVTDPLFFVFCCAQREPIEITLIDDGAAARIFSEVRLGKRFNWLPRWLDPLDDRNFVMSLTRIKRIRFFSKYSHRTAWPDEVVKLTPAKAEFLQNQPFSDAQNDWILSGRLKSDAETKRYLRTLRTKFHIDRRFAFFIPHLKEPNLAALAEAEGFTLFRPKQALGDFLQAQREAPKRIFTGPSTFVDEWVLSGGAPEKIFLILGPEEWYAYPEQSKYLWEAMRRDHPLINAIDLSTQSLPRSNKATGRKGQKVSGHEASSN